MTKSCWGGGFKVPRDCPYLEFILDKFGQFELHKENLGLDNVHLRSF